MPTRPRLPLILSCALALAGCASTGSGTAPAGVERVATYAGSASYAVYEGVPPTSVDARPRDALRAVLEGYRRLSLQPTDVDPQGLSVAVRGLQLTRRLEDTPLGVYLDCGLSSTGLPLANDARVTVSFSTSIAAVPDGSGSLVTTRIDALAVPLEAGLGRSATRCATTGVFETDLLGHALDALGTRAAQDEPLQSPLSAREPPPSLASGPEALERTLGAGTLTSGNRVRIATAADSFPARVVRVSPDGLTVDRAGHVAPIAWAEVQHLQVRVAGSSRARLGAVLGAVVGLGVGLRTDLFINGDHAAQGRYLNPGFGVLAGSLIGALLGQTIREHRWERLW